MTDSEEKVASTSQEKEEELENLLDTLWKDLTSQFSPDVNHKDEEIILEIRGETLFIIPDTGNVYRTEKRMIAEEQWNALVRSNEEFQAAERPMRMPRAKPEKSSTSAEKEKETNSDEAEMCASDNEMNDEIEKDVEDEEAKEVVSMKMSDLRALVEASKEDTSKPQIRSIVTTKIAPKTINPISKQSKQGSQKTNMDNKNRNEIPVHGRLEKQETKMNELVTVVGSFCTATKTMMEQIGESLKRIREEHQQEYKLLKENEEKRETWKKLMTKINESYTPNTAKMVTTTEMLKDIYEDIKNYDTESIPDEIEGGVTKDNNSNLKEEISNLIKEQMNNLKVNEARKNHASPSSSLSDTVKETLKFEIINKNGGMKRDYKLDKNVKYEHFYDYFSSKLRSCGLLHIIDDKCESNADEKTLEEQRFKVRDILINHLDRNYHSKVMQIQNPKEILSKLKEQKRCEVNVTSHAVRKQLYSMQYIIGKTTAGEFCEKFEETIRNYENSPGATSVSEDEKRDAFYNAVMVSVPTVQSIEFLSKHTKGISPDYEQLKNLVMQDEATRKQLNGETSEVRTANLAYREGTRCYKCHATGHMAEDCSNQRILCYCCQKFGDHKAPDCPEAHKHAGGSGKGKDYSKGNNNNSYRSGGNYRGSGGSKFRRGLKRRANADYERNPKRERFESNRGRGNYKSSSQNQRTEKNRNKPKTSKTGNHTKKWRKIWRRRKHKQR